VATVSDIRDRVRGWFRREPRTVAPRTIMIVDGNAASRTNTAGLVGQLGFQTTQLSSAAEAIARLESDDPEFLLLGFELDDGDGLGALSEIREVDADLPIIMLAADLWDARAAEAMRRGAIAYLARPFGLDDLREVLVRS
jgi:DNA-binding NtrC family response regulator